MKKILKWIGIVLASIIVIVIGIIAYVLISHGRYGWYASGGLLSENQAAYDVIYYDIDLEVLTEKKSLAGSVGLKVKSRVPDLPVLELDLTGHFKVGQVTDAEGSPLAFKHRRGKLLIDLNPPAPLDELVDVTIHYSGKPMIAIRPPWIGGFNWSKDSTGAHWIGLSCQGEGGKIWFPCKDHPSDKPDSVAINITIPEPYYCASNGLLRNISTPREGFLTYHWFTGYPIHNYNVNISIAQYEILEKEYLTEEGHVMPVFFYHLPQSVDGAEKLLDMAIDMLYTYRRYYGEYPFTREKFAIVETDYLGMEHQTINAYGNRYRYQKLDSLEWDWLMLHEMGHEWWGNKVSLKDWADMWIHEGIGTFGEALYLREKGGEKAYHDHIRRIKRGIANKKPIIPKRDADSHEVYHGDIYKKGAHLMHTLRFLLGDSVFFGALKEFATDPAYTYQNMVVTDDFLNLIDKNSTEDYRAFLSDFLYTTRLPAVQVDSLGDNRYTLSIPNIDYTLPMEVTLDQGIQRIRLSKNPFEVYSTMAPIVDQREWFLKQGFDIADNSK